MFVLVTTPPIVRLLNGLSACAVAIGFHCEPPGLTVCFERLDTLVGRTCPLPVGAVRVMTPEGTSVS